MGGGLPDIGTGLGDLFGRAADSAITTAATGGFKPRAPTNDVPQAEQIKKLAATVLGQPLSKENAQRAAILNGTVSPDSFGRGKLNGTTTTGGSFLFRTSPAATNLPSATDKRGVSFGARET